MAARHVNAKVAPLRTISVEEKIPNISQQEWKESKAPKKIYVVKNVHLLNCIRGVCVSSQKIDVKIGFHQKDVSFVVVWAVILSKNRRGHLKIFLEANPKRAKVSSVFMMRWSTT